MSGDDVYKTITRRIAELEAEGKHRTQQVIEIDEATLADLRKHALDLNFSKTTVGERFCGALLKPVQSTVRFVKVT